MFSIASLLERAKARANIDTDYRLAKVLSINQSALGNYKAGRSFPNDKILAQLCALSGDDPGVIAAHIQAEKSPSDEGKSMWNLIAKRLAGGASTAILSVLFTIALIASPTGQARATEAQSFKSVLLTCYTSYQVAFLSVGQFVLDRHRRLPGLFRLWFWCLA